MEKFFRNNQELIFWLVSAFLSALLLLFLYFAFSFLLTKTGEVFGDGLKKNEVIVKFNVDKAEKIIRQKKNKSN